MSMSPLENVSVSTPRNVTLYGKASTFICLDSVTRQLASNFILLANASLPIALFAYVFGRGVCVSMFVCVCLYIYACLLLCVYICVFGCGQVFMYVCSTKEWWLYKMFTKHCSADELNI